MTKLFVYLLNNEPDGKILNKKEINNFKKIFYSYDKNIITTGLSELLGWDDMFNNENNNEKSNIEKILADDDILKNDYSFKEEDELDEAINGDINLNDIDGNDDNLILNNISEENKNNEVVNLLLRYQNILKNISLED